MSARALVAVWCVAGLVVWSAVFDWWMHGAAREYLLRAALHELGRGPEPSMAGLLAEARQAGLIRASLWAGLVTAAGLLTIRLKRT